MVNHPSESEGVQVTIQFDCPYCAKRVTMDPGVAGQKLHCPFCAEEITVPGPSTADAGETIFCTKCGAKNQASHAACAACGFLLHGPPRPQVVVDDTLDGLIPAKNPLSLWAYYLAIFSLIPCLGIPLGIVAAVLGVKALRHAKEHPESKGEIHAWVGILLGGICALIYTLLIVGLVIAAATAK